MSSAPPTPDHILRWAGVAPVFEEYVARNGLGDRLGFAKLTPYVTWHQKVGRTTRLFVGHLHGAQNPRFTLDSPGGIARSKAGLTLAVPSPISSDCAANPFNANGTACQGGTPGTPFFLFNDGAKGKRKIFAEAVTGGAKGGRRQGPLRAGQARTTLITAQDGAPARRVGLPGPPSAAFAGVESRP
jgi:hypothetical protein